MMYPGTDQSNLNTPVGANTDVTVGDGLAFTCMVENAHPAAQITWTLDGNELTNGINENTPQDTGGDNLYDTISSVTASTHTITAADCGKVLMCTSTHPESGDTQMASTILDVIGKLCIKLIKVDLNFPEAYIFFPQVGQ